MFISFSDIPGHQNLFLDYLYEFDNVSQFYKHDFRDKESYPSLFKKIIISERLPRHELVDILNSQYSSHPQTPSVEKNISMLAKENTLAVVTGQQLGILGGPLYTFYKIITSIKLANYLNVRHENYHFVPVFWLEGDDHDFDEVSAVNMLNSDNELIRLKYNDNAEPDSNRGSVGPCSFKETINDFLNDFDKSLRPTDFTNDILSTIKTFYAVGKTFKQSFREMISWLFDKYGLIIFDPQDLTVKQKLSPLFKKEITSYRSHTQKVINVSATLEELYHAQVKVRPINLFYNYDEGRYLIEPVENEFRLRGKRKRFSYDELISLIDSNPERFSPNVLFRPVCQDYLFPTAFYVGGPSEIAYFAQVMPLYEMFNLEPPVIYPRSSASILEKGIKSILEKYNLEIKNIFMKSEQLKDSVISSLESENLDKIFDDAVYQVELTFDNLKEKLFDIDKTISDSGTKYKQNVLNNIQQLKAKAVEAQKKKHEVSLRQIDKLNANLFPNSSLQEREINFFYYANKYGIQLIDKMFEEIEINKFEHQVISI